MVDFELSFDSLFVLRRMDESSVDAFSVDMLGTHAVMAMLTVLVVNKDLLELFFKIDPGNKPYCNKVVSGIRSFRSEGKTGTKTIKDDDGTDLKKVNLAGFEADDAFPFFVSHNGAMVFVDGPDGDMVLLGQLVYGIVFLPPQGGNLTEGWIGKNLIHRLGVAPLETFKPKIVWDRIKQSGDAFNTVLLACKDALLEVFDQSTLPEPPLFGHESGRNRMSTMKQSGNYSTVGGEGTTQKQSGNYPFHPNRRE